MSYVPGADAEHIKGAVKYPLGIQKFWGVPEPAGQDTGWPSSRLAILDCIPRRLHRHGEEDNSKGQRGESQSILWEARIRAQSWPLAKLKGRKEQARSQGYMKDVPLRK